jgi:hypothetical protein
MRNKLIIAGIALASGIFGTAFFYATTTAPLVAERIIANDQVTAVSASGISLAQMHDSVMLSVLGAQFEVATTSETTVLAVMHAAASTYDLTFSGHEYPSLGFFVDSINGVESVGGSYWFLYINGATSTLGASHAVVIPGDTIEWRHEKSL